MEETYMIRHSLLALTGLLLAISPALVCASACKDLTNTINEDITKYADTLKNQNLPWMKLSFLQEQLGDAAVSDAGNNQVQYEWKCENDDGYLIAKADKSGRLLNISGEYNSSSGSGLFSANVPNIAEREFNEALEQIRQAPPELLPVVQPAEEKKENKTVEQCSAIIDQIRNDTSEDPARFKRPQFPWLKLSWLQQQLGSTPVTAGYDYVYIWDKYSLFMGMDGTTAASGKLPEGAHPASVGELNALLGHPRKTLFEKLNQYSWQCPGNNGSSLSVITDKKNSVIWLAGRDCTDGLCGNFTAPLKGSDLKREFSAQSQQQTQMEAQTISIMLRDYNEFYKTTLQNQDELTADITAKIKNYYSSLRTCKPGIYQYPIPVMQSFIFNTSVIREQKDGRCFVDTSYDIPQIGKVELKCKYDPQSLQLFTDAEADSAAQGKTSYDTDHPDELQKLNNNQCQRYLNGVL